MLSVPMLPIVATTTFDPRVDAATYLSSPTSPLLGPEAIGIKKGQTLFAIGYDPYNALFFATNCKQMPFCSIATTGYIPRDVFYPIQGVLLPTVTLPPPEQDVVMDSEEEVPNHSASLSTPDTLSDNGSSASELEDDVMLVEEQQQWQASDNSILGKIRQHVQPHLPPVGHPIYP